MAVSNPFLSVFGGPRARSWARVLLPSAAAVWKKAPILLSRAADGLFRSPSGLPLLARRATRTQMASPLWSSSAFVSRAALEAAGAVLLEPQPARATIVATQKHRARTRASRGISRRNETRAPA